jgi:hypothetical protein
MLKTWLWRSLVVGACCIGITGCTTSRWVTDSRTEVFPDASATTVRPILEVGKPSQERPEIRVKLSKHVNGPIEVQVRKHEQIEAVWGNSLLNVGFGWLFFPITPYYCLMATIGGKPSECMSIPNSLRAAAGFNAPEDSFFHISERTGESALEKVPMGAGIRQLPGAFGRVTVKIDDQAPIALQANESGLVIIDLKKLPVQLSGRSKDLVLAISAQEGGMAAVESVTVPVAAIVAWEQKEAARAKLEEIERPLREARARAAQARAAELERIEQARVAAEALAFEQEQARKAEEDSRAGWGAMAAGLGASLGGGNTTDVLNATKQSLESGNTSGAASQFAGAFGQAQQNKLNALRQQQEEQQRQLLAQQEQQRIARIQQEEQRRAYNAEAAQADAFNREAALAAERTAKQKQEAARQASSEETVGRPLNFLSGPPGRSSSEPAPLHIPAGEGRIPGLRSGPFTQPGVSEETKRQREQERVEGLRQAEAERLRKAEERAVARQQKRDEEKSQQEAQWQATAARIRSEVSRQDAITHFIISDTCPPRIAIRNNTSVKLSFRWDFSYVEYNAGLDGRQPISRTSWVTGTANTKHGADIEIQVITACHSGKQWRISPGGRFTWEHAR